MTKIFISYRRKSSAFTLLLANKLSESLDAEIFVDFESIDQADFETSILSHLRSSDVFLLMVTEHTFAERIHRADDWVRQEIRIALENKIPIVLVSENGLYPPHDLPDDIRGVRGKQGIEFYPAYFDAAVARLVKFLGKAANVPPKTRASASHALPVPIEKIERVAVQSQKQVTSDNARQVLLEAIQAYEASDYAQALFLFEALQNINYRARMVNITQIVNDIRQEHEREERGRLAEIEYDEIALFAGSNLTRTHALDAFAEWVKKYPEWVEQLDYKGLRNIKTPSKPISRSLMPAPFEWITIPAGRGTMQTDEKNVTLEIPTEAYQIAKYPITNGQYAKFVDAGGYKNEQWWTDAGWEARLKGWVWNSSKQEFEITNNPWTEPRYWSDSKWNGANQPVVGVSWYEAVAFCLWLSDVTGEKIMLPTEAQWQYAAQGTDGRQYPWGNDWDKDKCNSRESGHGKTTPVTQYEKVGKSPFGVVDMAGNVWEWCLTDYEQLTNDINSNANRRVLRGGSWGSGSTDFLRVAVRDGGNPDYWLGSIGFRCVLSQLTIGQHSSEF